MDIGNGDEDQSIENSGYADAAAKPPNGLLEQVYICRVATIEGKLLS